MCTRLHDDGVNSLLSLLILLEPTVLVPSPQRKISNCMCVNRSSFTKDGKDYKLHSDVEKVLKEFHRHGKPIG